jgi:thiol:disulfide interchange protein DsbA
MRNYLVGSLLSLALVVGSQAATTPTTTNWVEGEHYFLIKPAQPTTVAPGKVEVTEVFSYGCPACFQFYPTADKVKAALPKNAEMTYLPASWNAAEQWPLFQRAFLTAQALGIADKAHDAMFNAIWTSDELAVVDRRTNRVKNPAPTLEQVAAFYERTTGVKKDEFLKYAKSFSIEVRIKSTENAIKALRADQTPTMVVNGKYRFTTQSAGGDNQVIELTKWLVAKETK